MIVLHRINHSFNSTYEANNSNTFELTISKGSADILNERTPLIKDVDHHRSFGDDPEERITFADIPMPGVWEKDKPGKNTDRIIVLLFVMLASMIVVSTNKNLHM